MKKANRIFSGFLALVMILSLFPSSVFGVTPSPDANQDSGPTGAGAGAAPTSGWSTPGNDWGLKFSLYFAEGITEEQIPTAEFVELGETYYVRMNGAAAVSYVSGYDIYNQAQEGSNINFGRTSVNSANVIDKSKVPVLNGFPSDLLTKGSDMATLNKFFAGVATTKRIPDELDENELSQLNFKNTCEIANVLLASKGITINDTNWQTGSYVQDGKTHKGVFKLYYEPFYQFTVASTGYLMTLHDAISFQSTYPNMRAKGNSGNSLNFRAYFATYLLNLANGVFLAYNEPSLGMGPANAMPISRGTSQAASNANYSTVMNDTNWAKMWNGNGIGVITGSIQSGKYKIIASYVEIEKVAVEGGKVHIYYKTIKETENITPEVPVTEDNIAQLQAVRQVDLEGETMDAFLNDIVSSKKDITGDGAEKIVWENVKTPQAPSDRINPTIEEV